MSANQRGCRSLIITIAVIVGIALFQIWFLPKVLGTGVTLPVITVPPEKYLENWPSPELDDFFVNTLLGGALMADIMVLIFAFSAGRWSNGWTKKIPGRGQAAAELVVDGLWGLTKQQAGHSPKVKTILFPIVASLFVFLLAANWGKLIPGVESVGILHCAAYKPVAFSGLPIHEGNILGRPVFTLRVSNALDVGTTGTADAYHRCESFISHHYEDVELLDPFYDAAVTHTTVEGDTLDSIAAQYTTAAEETMKDDLPQVTTPNSPINSGYITETFEGYHGWAPVEFHAEDLLALNAGAAAAPLTDAEGHTTTPALTSETVLKPGQTITVRNELLGYEATTFRNQLFTVAPFVRGAATDLNLTLGLAIFSFCLIQYFGLSTLGPNYLQKFVNINALGNAGTRPLGIVDFVAGIFEIVSELGKIISLSFRLFGALFAGSILFAVFLFLFGTFIPVAILFLEIIVGGAQAAVFAILTLIFTAQAMVSHAHDDHDHHDEVGDAHVDEHDGGHGQPAHGVSA